MKNIGNWMMGVDPAEKGKDTTVVSGFRLFPSYTPEMLFVQEPADWQRIKKFWEVPEGCLRVYEEILSEN